MCWMKMIHIIKKYCIIINNIILPKLKDENIISNVIKMIMECKTDISCDILNFIYIKIYHKIYKEYKKNIYF